MTQCRNPLHCSVYCGQCSCLLPPIKLRPNYAPHVTSNYSRFFHINEMITRWLNLATWKQADNSLLSIVDWLFIALILVVGQLELIIDHRHVLFRASLKDCQRLLTWIFLWLRKMLLSLQQLCNWTITVTTRSKLLQRFVASIFAVLIGFSF